MSDIDARDHDGRETLMGRFLRDQVLQTIIVILDV